MKRLVAFVYFLDHTGLALKRSCRGEIMLHEDGVSFDGYLHDLDQPDFQVKIRHGIMYPALGEVAIRIMSDGEVLMMSSSDLTRARGTSSSFGFVGRHGRIDESEDKHDVVVASFTEMPD